LGARDRAVTVELPVRQPVNDDVGQPHLQGGDEQLSAVIHLCGQQCGQQLRQGVGVRKADQPDETEGGSARQLRLAGQTARVHGEQRHEQRQPEGGNHVPPAGHQAVRQQCVQGDGAEDRDGRRQPSLPAALGSRTSGHGAFYHRGGRGRRTAGWKGERAG